MSLRGPLGPWQSPGITLGNELTQRKAKNAVILSDWSEAEGVEGSFRFRYIETHKIPPRAALGRDDMGGDISFGMENIGPLYAGDCHGRFAPSQ